MSAYSSGTSKVGLEEVPPWPHPIIRKTAKQMKYKKQDLGPLNENVDISTRVDEVMIALYRPIQINIEIRSHGGI